MRCVMHWRLALLCLAAAAAACSPRAAAAPLIRDDWQERSVNEFLSKHRLIDGSSGGGSGGAAPASADPLDLCKNFTFTQRVDHFNQRNAHTWQQRYYVCDGLWTKGARQPLFVYLGAEAPLNGPFNSLFVPMAAEQGGLLLFIEHRYYGQSLPLGPTESFTNAGLRWLTIENALADFVAITAAVRKAYAVPRTAASVGYGGSYGGSLAAWARLLYPQTFQATLASSSVVRYMVGGESFQRTKYETWRAVTASVRAVGGAACAARVALGYATLQGRLSWTNEGRAQLAAAARHVREGRCLCPGNALEGPADIEGLVSILNVAWWYIFQSLQPATNPVPAACQRILTAFPATPLGAVAAISNFTRSQLMRNATCIKAEDSALPFSTEDERPHEPDAVAYTAQCCMQGTPISTDFWSAPPSIFGVYSAPLSRITSWCRRNYGLSRPLNVPRRLEYSPRAYQAVGNIIFTSGGVDPWRPGAPPHPLGPTLPAIQTPNASHCADLGAARATTTAAVNATQAAIRGYIQRWVIDWPKPGRPYQY